MPGLDGLPRRLFSTGQARRVLHPGFTNLPLQRVTKISRLTGLRQFGTLVVLGHGSDGIIIREFPKFQIIGRS